MRMKAVSVSVAVAVAAAVALAGCATTAGTSGDTVSPSSTPGASGETAVAPAPTGDPIVVTAPIGSTTSLTAASASGGSITGLTVDSDTPAPTVQGAIVAYHTNTGCTLRTTAQYMPYFNFGTEYAAAKLDIESIASRQGYDPFTKPLTVQKQTYGDTIYSVGQYDAGALSYITAARVLNSQFLVTVTLGAGSEAARTVTGGQAAATSSTTLSYPVVTASYACPTGQASMADFAQLMNATTFDIPTASK